MAKIKRAKIQNAKIKLGENFPIYGTTLFTSIGSYNIVLVQKTWNYDIMYIDKCMDSIEEDSSTRDIKSKVSEFQWYQVAWRNHR